MTPSEHASEEKRRWGAITRLDNPYLLNLPVQWANTIRDCCHGCEDPLCQLARWLLTAGKRRSVVVVAITNRLARILSAVTEHHETAGRVTHSRLAGDEVYRDRRT